MGYTHYWRKQNGRIPQDAWEKICADAHKLIDAAPCTLAFEEDDPRPPAVERGMIRFNGTPDPQGHETFLLTPEANDFDFCKTASKPYDKVVVAVLAVAKEHAPEHIRVSSDGGDTDWQPGLTWASQVLGRTVPIPFTRETNS